MKKLEKWLLNPLVQRLVYLLLLLSCYQLLKTNGSLGRIGIHNTQALTTTALVLLPVLLLIAQLIWNRLWLWWLLCGLSVCGTLWLATLSLSQIMGLAGGGAKAVVWWVGVFGFILLLVLVLAFTNWVLLHMKPRK